MSNSPLSPPREYTLELVFMTYLRAFDMIASYNLPLATEFHISKQVLADDARDEYQR